MSSGDADSKVSRFLMDQCQGYLHWQFTGNMTQASIRGKFEAPHELIDTDEGNNKVCGQ